MLPFLLDKYLRVKWLNHIVGECLTFRETVKLFSKWLYYFQFPPAMCESSSCSIPEISKLCPIDQIWPAICFFMARELGMGFTFSSGWEKTQKPLRKM